MDVSISDAGQRAGVRVSTIYRWIRSARLEQNKGGLVDLRVVFQLRDDRRTGRPGGLAYGRLERPVFEQSEVDLEEVLRTINQAIESVPSEKLALVWEPLLSKWKKEKAFAATLEKIYPSTAHSASQVVATERDKMPESPRVQALFEGFDGPSEAGSTPSKTKGRRKKK